MSAPHQLQEDEHEEEQNDDYDPEAEVIGNWKICDLPVAPVVTGEEEEDTLLELRSKVYRWRGQWKERGIGPLKLLKHKKTGLVRILMRADKTHKCIINHLLQKKDNVLCRLQQLKTSNNAWTWIGYDISDGEGQAEKLCARFKSKENFIGFREEFEKACEENEKILKGETEQKLEGGKIESKEEQN